MQEDICIGRVLRFPKGNCYLCSLEMKAGKVIRNVFLGIIGLMLVLLVAFQVLMRPKVLTGIVNDFAADYVQGDVSFSKIKAHVIKSFPYLNVEAEDLVITYPHARYARFDSIYPDAQQRFSLVKAGWERRSVPGQKRGVPVTDGTDTLISLKKLSVAVDYMAFLSNKEIHVHKAELERPRIFAHYYDSTAANWDILPIGGDKDTTEKSGMPVIKLDRIHLTDRPFIVFTNPEDTLHGMFTMRRLLLDGHLETANLFSSKAGLKIDSLFISGRLPADTVALALQSLSAQMDERNLSLDATAKARLRTGSYGRMQLPISLKADAFIPEAAPGEMGAEVKSLNLAVSALELNGAGTVWKRADGTMDLDVEAAIKEAPLGSLIEEFDDNIPFLKKISTDAILSLDAKVKGRYGAGDTPAVDAHILIPPAKLDYEGLGRKGRLGLDIVASTNNLKEVNANIEKLFLDFVGAKIDAVGNVQDVLGDDPLVNLRGNIHARIDSLTNAFTRESGILGTGRIDAKLQGKARLSQLDMVHIGNATINCDLTARDFSLDMPDNKLHAFLPELDMNLATKANKIDRNIRQGARVLALKADADTLDVTLDDMFIRGSKVKLLLQNSADILKGGKDLTPLMGLLKAGSLRVRDSEGMAIGLRDNMEQFRISPATKERPTPRLSLKSESGGIRARIGENIYALRGVKIDLAASRHQRRQGSQARRNHLLDSLQRVYPGVPRDSLFRKARQNRERRLLQDEFASKDIKISLGKSISDYLRTWDVEGLLETESGRLVMPSFPLKTSLSAVKGRFDNDTLDLQNLTVQAGESDISAKATLSGLRRALAGRGRSKLKLKANVSSNYIDANELMRGYAYYSAYEPPKEASEASDEAVESATQAAVLPDSTSSKLIVIPSNLEVDFSLEASGIKYDSLLINWAAADVAMRDRTLQITNALAASNMGDIFFEGFYATRSKKDIKAGFDLNLVDITAEKVITLFPAVDTLMPMLTSFAGDLDCELAATTDIDTCMNLVLPSIDGIMKISGKDLSLKDSEEFTKIAKLLMFKDKKKAIIDNMAVTGMIKNNILEVFPFVLDVDRYQLAASGTQHLTEEFNYHISVIRSPLLFKFGLNAWGPDFDHIHYGLGRAKYLSANVPVFTKQLDTAQYSLVAAIHNIFELGVEKAMAENRTAEYLAGAGSAINQAESYQSADSLATSDSLARMRSLLEDVLSQTSSNREALKEEVVRLEAEAAQTSQSAKHE